MMIARVALLALSLASPALGAVKMDPLAGTWRDDFTDLAGLSYKKHAATAYPTGVTIDTGIQYWIQPSSTSGIVDSFSSGTRDAGVEILLPGTSQEVITLFRNKLNPGADMYVNQKCSLGAVGTCSIPPYTLISRRNGEAFMLAAGLPDEPPGENSYVAGWGLIDGMSVPKCLGTYSQQIDSILAFYGEHLVSGAGDRKIVRGEGYNFTFLPSCDIVSSTCTDCVAGDPQLIDPKYVRLKVVNADTAGVLASTYASTTDFVVSTSHVDDGQYGGMVPFTLHLPNVAADRLDYPVEVTSTNVWDKFCFSLGPVVVTADQGHYESKVFDTLSDRTRWVDIAWELDQSTGYSDSGPAWSLQHTASSTTPMTPVLIKYSVSNSSGFLPAVDWTVNHYNWKAGLPPPPTNDYTLIYSSTLMCDAAGATLQGRYFKYSLDLFSRSTAETVDLSLKPVNLHPTKGPEIYFGGLLPKVRRIVTRYYACAAEIISRPIAPGSVKSWGSITFRANKPTAGTSVAVDVLAADGTVLLPGVVSGASLSGVDPYKNPSIKLRARFESDPGDCSVRPELEYWAVNWEPIPEVLVLDRNGIRPDKGELVRGQVRVDEPGHVVVQVHDAAGQSVKILLDGDRPAQATFVTWNGKNERGETVAPGIYFIAAVVPGAKKVRRVAVIR